MRFFLCFSYVLLQTPEEQPVIFGCIVLQAITWTCQLLYNDSALGFEPQATGVGYPAQHWGCPANKGQGAHQAHESCSQRAKNVTATPRVSPPCLHAGPDSPPGQLVVHQTLHSDLWEQSVPSVLKFPGKAAAVACYSWKLRLMGYRTGRVLLSLTEVRTPNLYTSCPLRYIYLFNLPNATTEFAISHVTSLVSCIFFFF